MKPLDRLLMAQVERRENSIRSVISEMRVRPGWIHFMRTTLGMTLDRLADRAGVSKSTVAQAVRGEAKSKITIETLKNMAEAMECEFVYAFVPKKSIRSTLKENALKKAARILSTADTHMLLEDQRVTTDLKSRIEKLAETLIERGQVW